MKANELRIGNYFLHDGNIVQFDEDIMHDVKYGGLEGDEPIPLTEEWLLKFGYIEKDLESGSILIVQENNIDVGFIIRSLHANKVLKYVHKLQNLYFALNDEELTIM